MLEHWAKNKRLEAYVVTAIPVGPHLYVAYNVVAPGDSFIGSVVLCVDRATLASSVVYESSSSMIDYVVDASDGWQFILLEDCMLEVPPGKKPVVTVSKAKVPKGLYRIANIGGHEVAICGDDGSLVTYSAKKLKQRSVTTGPASDGVEDLCAIAADDGALYVVGGYGTFSGGTRALVPCWGKTSPFTIESGRSTVFSVYVSKDEIILGGDDGIVAAYPKGSTKWTHLIGLPDDVKVFAIVEFRGKQYVSTEEGGFYLRDGSKLKKQKGEAGGYRMEANADVLASSCGAFVYLYDGKAWTRLRIRPNPKKLVEKVKLDF